MADAPQIVKTAMSIEAGNNHKHEKPEKKQRRPNRKQTRSQVTVRIDQNLLKALRARAEGEGLRITDAIEAGAWLWLQRERESETVVLGRALWNEVGLRLQELTVPFWVYVHQPRGESAEEIMRKAFIECLEMLKARPDYQHELREFRQRNNPPAANELKSVG